MGRNPPFAGASALGGQDLPVPVVPMRGWPASHGDEKKKLFPSRSRSSAGPHNAPGITALNGVAPRPRDPSTGPADTAVPRAGSRAGSDRYTSLLAKKALPLPAASHSQKQCGHRAGGTTDPRLGYKPPEMKRTVRRAISQSAAGHLAMTRSTAGTPPGLLGHSGSSRAASPTTLRGQLHISNPPQEHSWQAPLDSMWYQKPGGSNHGARADAKLAPRGPARDVPSLALAPRSPARNSPTEEWQDPHVPERRRSAPRGGPAAQNQLVAAASQGRISDERLLRDLEAPLARLASERAPASRAVHSLAESPPAASLRSPGRTSPVRAESLTRSYKMLATMSPNAAKRMLAVQMAHDVPAMPKLTSAAASAAALAAAHRHAAWRTNPVGSAGMAAQLDCGPRPAVGLRVTSQSERSGGGGLASRTASLLRTNWSWGHVPGMPKRAVLPVGKLPFSCLQATEPGRAPQESSRTTTRCTRATEAWMDDSEEGSAWHGAGVGRVDDDDSVRAARAAESAVAATEATYAVGRIHGESYRSRGPSRPRTVLGVLCEGRGSDAPQRPATSQNAQAAGREGDLPSPGAPLRRASTATTTGEMLRPGAWGLAWAEEDSSQGKRAGAADKAAVGLSPWQLTAVLEKADEGLQADSWLPWGGDGAATPGDDEFCRWDDDEGR